MKIVLLLTLALVLSGCAPVVAGLKCATIAQTNCN